VGAALWERRATAFSQRFFASGETALASLPALEPRLGAYRMIDAG
jgi:hypothetical protein